METNASDPMNRVDLRGSADARVDSFAPHHKWDRNFFLVMVTLGWLGIIMGFGSDIANHIVNHLAPYPLIVHFHAAVFVGWMILFTVQIFLIRSKNIRIHRKLGSGMALLVVLMVFLGPATALTVQHIQLQTRDPDADPAFLIFQLTDIAVFAGLIVGAFLLRKVPSTHKRLALLATLAITDAGFFRWLGYLFSANSYWSLWLALYLFSNLLIAGVAGYDLMTRRRIHPASMIGITWIVANQLLAIFFYRWPLWTVVAKHIISLWP